jgi:hypothetical protein
VFVTPKAALSLPFSILYKTMKCWDSFTPFFLSWVKEQGKPRVLAA